MKPSMTQLAVTLALGLTITPVLAASSDYSKTALTLAKTNSLALQPVPTTRSVTGLNDKTMLPAVQQPASNKSLEAQSQARMAQGLGKFEHISTPEQAHRALGQGGSGQNLDPAMDTALGGRGISSANATTRMPDFSSLSNATPSGDCIRNAAECVRGNANRSPGRFAGPPSAGSSVPDKRSVAASGFTSQAVNIDSGGSGYIKAVHVDRNGNRTSMTREYSPDRQGGGTITTRITTSDEKGKQTGSGTSTVSYNRNGDVVDNSSQRTGQSPSTESEGAMGVLVRTAESEAAARETTPSNDEASQPNENQASTDNCGWHPIAGCTQKRSKNAHKDMTRSPSRGDTGGTTTGSGVPRLNTSAVTNSGDGSWSVGRIGSGGDGRPLDMRDPPKGDDDGQPVPRGGFASH